MTDSLYQRAARAAHERAGMTTVMLDAAELEWLCDKLRVVALSSPAETDQVYANLLFARFDAARIGLTEKKGLGA